MAECVLALLVEQQFLYLIMLPACHQRCRGHLAMLQSVHLSVCPSVNPMYLWQKQCILGVRLLKNTNRKPHAGSRTRWCALPSEVAEMALNLKNLCYQYLHNEDR